MRTIVFQWQALIFLRNIRSLQLQTSLDDTLDAILELDPATVGILCAQFAQYFFAAGAVRLHFDYIGENVGNWRSEIQLIARNVFAAFRFLFNSADWLDEGEKVKLLEKLNIVQVDPGLFLTNPYKSSIHACLSFQDCRIGSRMTRKFRSILRHTTRRNRYTITSLLSNRNSLTVMRGSS